MILIILSIMIKYYYFLNAYQKSFYEFTAFLKLPFFKYFIMHISTIFVVLLYFFRWPFLYLLLFITLLFEVVFILKRVKVLLVFTKRVLRIILTSLIIVIALIHLIPIHIFDFTILLVILLSNIINKPIELFIDRYYIKKALAKIKKLTSIKIAITGSYGKTSVKHFLANTLQNKFIVKYSPKSYNTPLGLAKFINNNDFTHQDFLIYEFGARKKGDIYELARLFSYDIAIVTSIGKMHLDSFRKLETIIEEKMSICSYISDKGFVILNYENEYIREFELFKKKYTYGFNYGLYQARNIKLGIFGSSFDLYINGDFIESFEITPLGRGAILNVLPSIILCDIYKIDYQVISKINVVENRLSLRILDDYYILDDAYNSNLLGATYALEVVKSHSGKKFLLTPGFIEMDSILLEVASKYADVINDSCDYVILVKNKFTLCMSDFIKVEIKFVETFKKGFELFLSMKEEGSILLIENDLYE